MEWLHSIEELFLVIAQTGEVILEGIAVVCVLIGLLATAKLLMRLTRRRQNIEFPFVEVRLKFGLWLALALEFQLGSDILNTTYCTEYRSAHSVSCHCGNSNLLKLLPE
jgi:uncharacterized membrane protein